MCSGSNGCLLSEGHSMPKTRPNERAGDPAAMTLRPAAASHSAQLPADRSGRVKQLCGRSAQDRQLQRRGWSCYEVQSEQRGSLAVAINAKRVEDVARYFCGWLLDKGNPPRARRFATQLEQC